MDCQYSIFIQLVCLTMFACGSESAGGNSIWEFDPISEVIETSVIMLDVESELLANLRRRLMALGVEVFNGTAANDIGPDPLVIVDREGLRRSKENGKLKNAITKLAGAQICVVLNSERVPLSPQNIPAWCHSNVSLLLLAAGVNFVFELNV